MAALLVRVCFCVYGVVMRDISTRVIDDLRVCCLCWSRGFMWARWSLVAMWSLVARVFFAGRMRDGHRFRA